MGDLRLAVVGCGGMGRVHLERWANVSGVSIEALCDANSGVVAAAQREFGGEAHTRWREMLSAMQVDIVDVCVPPILHEPVVVGALEAGAHVICEKPLARTPAEAQRMMDAAERTGRLLMTAFCHRFHPPILFARELIDNDDLGRLRMVRNRFSGAFAGVENLWFSDPEMAGGGALLDTAIHSIDLFRFLAGEVRSAAGRIATFNPALSVEDSAVVVLEAQSGALGVIEASWSTPNGRNIVEIYGSAGACFVDYDTNRIRYKSADMSVWETREVGGPDRFQREIDSFADAVRGLQPLRVTGHDGLRANEIVAEVLASARA
ncbi:MAG TPA: Gfo/Idh/MocA family oxidoreductase [Chthonomonadales bacterium]|nr:Gfo/Idh/MocA family oxidoreductase [Chthonomonadales bacterium]